MSGSRDGVDPGQSRSTDRAMRLTLDIAFAPNQISGTLTGQDGARTTFQGWLGLAQAVASAGGTDITGTALLDPGDTGGSHNVSP